MLPKTSTAHNASGSRALARLLAIAAVLLSASAARAQADDPSAIDKVTRMNKKAVEEYDNLNFEEARKILKDALDVCSQNGLDKHPIKARTHLHLGVVILAGFKQREVAIKQFRKALEIQPDIRLTKSLANPEIQEAFDEAAAGAGKPEPSGGTGPAAGGGEDKNGDKTGEKADKPDGEAAGDEKPAEPFMHKPVTQATQGRPIVIEAIVDPALGAKRIVLAYRAGESGDFLGRQMKEVSPTKWASEIPATATGGNRVTYYVEAQKDDGESLAAKGSSDDPLVVSLKGAGAPEPEEPGDDEDNGDRHWFIGLGIGSGIGWATGNGEVNVDHKISPAGFAPSGLGHVLPEIGYFVQPGLLLSLQLRFQYITGPTEETTTNTSECGGDGVCSPAKSALAVFGRVTKLFGSSSLHPFVTGMVGAGYVRHVADFPSVGMVCGANSKQECVDTVAAGPFLIGPGGGVLYNLTPGFALSAGVGTFLAFPNFTYQIDFNAGAAVEF